MSLPLRTGTDEDHRMEDGKTFNVLRGYPKVAVKESSLRAAKPRVSGRALSRGR